MYPILCTCGIRFWLVRRLRGSGIILLFVRIIWVRAGIRAIWARGGLALRVIFFRGRLFLRLVGGLF